MHLKILKNYNKYNPKKVQGMNNKDQKIREEINETESKRTTQRTNETKNWFFEKTNKIYKP
jgi:hypothetical protein